MRKYTFYLLGLFLLTSSCKSKEEKIKAEEEKGAFVTDKSASFIKGVGESLKNKGKEAAESVSEGVGEMVMGANTGFDKSLTKVTVKTPENIEEYFTVGRSGKKDGEKHLEITVYLLCKKDFDKEVILKAFDKDANEIGRKDLKIKIKENETAYFDFSFDSRMPINLVECYSLELKP